MVVALEIPPRHLSTPPNQFKLAWFWTSPSTSTPTSPPLDATQKKPGSPPKPLPQPSLIMSQPYPPPPTAMTPSFCFNERALRDFLRLSRSAIDDTISTSLNALLTPSSTAPLTATTTSRISSPRPPSRTPLPPASCRAFAHSVLFPTWQTRSDLLTYCASVATSPDPDDPTLLSREIESQRERERVVDERLDPYSARSAAGLYRRTARTEALAQLLRNERAVEHIIRERSWTVMQDRCAGGMEGKWEEALDKWREEQADGRAKEGR